MKKTKSKMLSLLLAFVLVLGLMPTIAFAEDETATASNGTTITGATTQEALDIWAGEGAVEITAANGVTTVKLLKNFNFPSGTQPITFGDVLVNPDEVMVLDLNGHSISSTTIVIQSGCDLTIRDSKGGGKIYMDTSAKPASAFSAIVNQKKLTIEGGIFEAKIHESNPTTGVIGSAVADVETVINGGTFKSNCSAISVTSGTTTVNGGTFAAGTYGVVSRNTAVVNFPSDTQAAVTSDKFPFVVGTYYGTSAGQINIDGGDFDGINATALVGKTGSVTPTDLVKISGGTFTNSPVDYAGDDTSVVKGSAYYGVGTDAATLVENAAAGDTLTLIRYDSEITVPENVNIDNQTGSPVTVNGDTLEAGQTITTTHDVIATAAKEATCTEAGNIAYWYCTICDKYYSDAACTQEIEPADATIIAKGHGETELKNAKEATCIAEGYTGDKVCKTCGEVIEAGKAVAKTMHVYKDGKCTVCGATDPGYKPNTQPGGTTGATDTTTTGKDVPKTDDNNNITFYLILMLISILSFTGTAVYSRKK